MVANKITGSVALMGLVLLLSCADQPTSPQDTICPMDVSIEWTAAQQQRIASMTVDSIRITVASASLSSPRTATYPYTADSGSVDSIPPGITFTVTVQGLDQDGRLLFTGTAADVQRGACGGAQSVDVPAQMVPVAPSGLTAKQISSTSLSILWVDNSDDESGFVLSRAGSTGTFAIVDSLDSGTVAYVDSGLTPATIYRYTVQAVNAVGLSAVAETLIAATPAVGANVAPSFAVSSAALTDTVEAGEEYRKLLFASDPDSGDSIRFVLHPTLTRESDSVITWRPVAADSGLNPLYALVYDVAEAKDSLGWSVLVTYTDTVNHAPLFDSATVDLSDTAWVGALYVDTLTAGDIDDADTVRYARVAGPDSLGVGEMTGVVTWTPAIADTGVRSVSVGATDGRGGADTLSWDLTVLLDNAAPRISTDSASMIDTVRVGGLYRDTVAAIDSDSGQALVYSPLAGPDSLSVDSVGGAVAWTPQLADTGDHHVSIMAADPWGAADTVSWTITVADTNVPPVFTSDSVSMRDTAAGGSEFRDTIHATDANGDALTFTFIDSAEGMALTDSVIVWNPANADSGAYEMSIVVSDVRGAADTLSWTVTVKAELSSDATLSDLVFSPGKITPAFHPDTLEYLASLVSDSIDSATVTPTANDIKHQSVEVNGNTVESGQASNNTFVEAGEQETFTVKVTAEDGATARTYTLTTRRSGFVPVGTIGFTTADVWKGDMALSPLDGSPYYAFISGSSDGRNLTVMKYVNDTWAVVGNQDITGATAVGHVAIAISASGIPHVAYAEYESPKTVKVIKFENQSWVEYSEPTYMEAGAPMGFAIVMEAESPIIGMGNYAGDDSGELRVLQHNGQGWDTLGAGPVSNDSYIRNVKFFSYSGDLYVAYRQSYQEPRMIYVKKYDAGNDAWAVVGGGPVWTNNDDCESFSAALDPTDGTLYVATDTESKNWLTVKSCAYNGNTWSVVGSTAFARFHGSHAMTVAEGTPYIAYGRYSLTTGANRFAMARRFNGTSWEKVRVVSQTTSGLADKMRAETYDNVPYIGFKWDGADYKAAVEKLWP